MRSIILPYYNQIRSLDVVQSDRFQGPRNSFTTCFMFDHTRYGPRDESKVTGSAKFTNFDHQGLVFLACYRMNIIADIETNPVDLQFVSLKKHRVSFGKEKLKK